MTTSMIPHLVHGQRLADGERFGDVRDPRTGAVQRRVPLGSSADVDRAVDSAVEAQPDWAARNPQQRGRVLVRFAALVHEHLDELAALLTSEHGKTLDDARGDLQRGLDVVEFATGIPHLLKGQFSSGVGAGIDVHSMHQPLGVVAGITPFNFPAMIPLWKMAPAIACGNAFVLKPSERDPSVPLRLAELLLEAGLPPGVCNVVHGDRETVESILAHKGIAAVGFVGSSAVAESIYATATANGKRAQCFGGAKNHLVVLPDADLDQVVDALVGAAFGSAGQRCMAISVVVAVGDALADELRARLALRVQQLRVGDPFETGVDLGPLVSADAVTRVHDALTRAVDDGAELVVDGRGLTVDGFDSGYFTGGSYLDHVPPGSDIHREEVFGPVLAQVRVRDLEEAITVINSHQYGNGVAIFTRDGAAAREFSRRIEVGMVGVNVPIPVPVAYHTFGGWKRSGFGDLGQHGPDSIKFFTRTKTVTTRWPSGASAGASFVIPTMN